MQIGVKAWYNGEKLCVGLPVFMFYLFIIEVFPIICPLKCVNLQIFFSYSVRIVIVHRRSLYILLSD